MRHVIDKVVLYFTVSFLSEDSNDCKDKGDQQYEGEDD
jgi:hypothetical protein